jgi:GT2 family glycosyltransferase
VVSKTAPVSVVIACHTEDRWNQILASVESVASQQPSPDSIVVSVDHSPNLFRKLVDRLPDVHVVENRFEMGASGNRNTGASETDTPFIAFLDDDARARSGWLAHLVEPFEDPMVVGTGGFVAPAWSCPKPRWFPDEFAWAVGASHIGLPTGQTSVRNVWGENMAVRRDTFDEVGGFRLDFGKVGNISRQEDTDLCIRMGRVREGGSWIYVPDAIVDHHVGEERSRVSFFLKRCFLEGRGKVELARINDGFRDLPDERAYLRHAIPKGIAKYVREGISSRELHRIYPAAAILGGVSAAGVGALAAFAKRDQFSDSRSNS